MEAVISFYEVLMHYEKRVTYHWFAIRFQRDVRVC